MSELKVVKPMIFLVGAAEGPDDIRKQNLTNLRLTYVALTSADNIVHCEILVDAAAQRLGDWRARAVKSRFYLERSDLVVVVDTQQSRMSEEVQLCVQWADSMRKPVLLLPPYTQAIPPEDDHVWTGEN